MSNNNLTFDAWLARVGQVLVKDYNISLQGYGLSEQEWQRYYDDGIEPEAAVIDAEGGV